jgi:hypothetical protein
MAQVPGLAKQSTAENMAAERWDPERADAGRVKLAGAAWEVLQRYLDTVLGAVLVLAGVLKAHQLITDPSAVRLSWLPRELVIGSAAFELAFGCWLLGGLYRRLRRWLALIWFTILAAVALIQAVGGAPACACFGELRVHPWLMFSCDVGALAALWTWSSHDYSSRRFLLTVLCLSLLPAAALLGFVGATREHTPSAEIDLGDIAKGGQEQQAFQLRNGSGAFLEVAAIETSCPCASIRLEQTGVPAGQFLAGTVTLDLRSKPKFTGNLAIEAKGFTRSGHVAFELIIWARVQSPS